MYQLQEEQIEQVIDLGVQRRGDVTESYLVGLGAQLGYALNQLMVGAAGTMKVRGTRSEIDSFTKALGSEKRYLDAYIANGLDDPRTLRNKQRLSKAALDFEKTTGLKWPFK